MHADGEPVLAFALGVREEDGEGREGRVGDYGGLCRWGRVGGWDGAGEGAGWWQGCGIMGLDRCRELDLVVRCHWSRLAVLRGMRNGFG